MPKKTKAPKKPKSVAAVQAAFVDATERAARDALGRLTLRQRKFIEHYATHGRMREAARFAGYSGEENTLSSIASQTLKLPYVAEALEAMIESDPLVLGRIERLRIRSEIARDKKEMSFARLAALDALDKIQGKLIDRLEITGASGGPLAVRVELEQMSTEQLRRIAEEPDVV